MAPAPRPRRRDRPATAEQGLIDKARDGSLNLCHFVVRGSRGSLGARAWLPVLLTLSVIGCSPQKSPAPVEDSLTSGRIRIVGAAETGALMERAREGFESTYPDADIELALDTSRGAMRALFAAEADLAVIVREMLPEERDAATRGGLALEGYRYARDALVAVVHPDNPVENLTEEQLRQIYTGTLGRWSDVGGSPAPIVPVMQPLESDVTEFFVDQVMEGATPAARVAMERSDSLVVRRVAADRNAIGYVTLAWGDRGARALRLSPLSGLPYWKPDLETVYRGDYPLTRFHNLYLRTEGRPLAKGFVTWMTSNEGQRLVHAAGLVPTTVPVRFVRRSPMLGSH